MGFLDEVLQTAAECPCQQQVGWFSQHVVNLCWTGYTNKVYGKQIQIFYSCTAKRQKVREDSNCRGVLVSTSIYWNVNSNSSVRPTCGVEILKTWGWHKWTLWLVCRSEGQTGTLAVSLESPAAHTHTKHRNNSIKWLTHHLIYIQVNNYIIFLRFYSLVKNVFHIHNPQLHFLKHVWPML